MANFAKLHRNLAARTIQLENREFRRKLEDLQAQARQQLGAQIAAFSGTGFGFTSGSYLAQRRALEQSKRRKLRRFREADKIMLAGKQAKLFHTLIKAGQRDKAKAVLRLGLFRSPVQGSSAFLGKDMSATNQ